MKTHVAAVLGAMMLVGDNSLRGTIQRNPQTSPDDHKEQELKYIKLLEARNYKTALRKARNISGPINFLNYHI